MSTDSQTEFDHSVLDKIDLSPVGAVPSTPSYQDALTRLYEARQVYAHADHKDGHITARALSELPIFYPDNLDDLIAGKIGDEEIEPNASIYNRYVASLPETLRARAESCRVMVIGKPIQHRAKHSIDPMHMLFLVPGAGPHPGIPGNYLFGSVYHLEAEDAVGSWVINVHDADDGASSYRIPEKPAILAMLQDVLASAPFHLEELDALGFTMN